MESKVAKNSKLIDFDYSDKTIIDKVIKFLILWIYDEERLKKRR